MGASIETGPCCHGKGWRGTEARCSRLHRSCMSSSDSLSHLDVPEPPDQSDECSHSEDDALEAIGNFLAYASDQLPHVESQNVEYAAYVGRRLDQSWRWLDLAVTRWLEERYQHAVDPGDGAADMVTTLARLKEGGAAPGRRTHAHGPASLCLGGHSRDGAQASGRRGRRPSRGRRVVSRSTMVHQIPSPEVALARSTDRRRRRDRPVHVV
jgi:hypothetical protein